MVPYPSKRSLEGYLFRYVERCIDMRVTMLGRPERLEADVDLLARPRRVSLEERKNPKDRPMRQLSLKCTLR